MMVYHRMVGDPPSRGFNDSLMTPGFPINPAMAGIKNARIAIVGIPGSNKPQQRQNAVTEQHRVYEVQSLPFGQVFAIHSAVGVFGSSRAHSYSDFVSLGAHPGCFTETLDADKLLSFDDFLPIDWFWSLDKQSNTIDMGQWDQKVKDLIFNKTLPDGFLQALLVYYWRSASRRMFDDKAEMVRICLGDEENHHEIIHLARCFMASLVTKNLPKVSQNILSFSAPVPQQGLQKFVDSAMVALYPDKQLHCEFDVRTGAFPNLTTEERVAGKMIAALAEGKQTPLATKLFERFKSLHPEALDHTCPLLADFDLMLALYRLDNALDNAANYPAIWMTITERLQKRHKLSEAEADAILHDLDQTMLETMTKNPEVPEFDETALRFLFRKALRLEEQQFSMASNLMARQQKHASLLNLENGGQLNTLSLPTLIQKEESNIRPENAEKVASILRTSLSAAYLDRFPNQTILNTLASVSFSKLCESHQPMMKTMQAYSAQLIEGHPGEVLSLLSLSKIYKQSDDGLGKTLQLALEKMKQETREGWPGGAHRANIEAVKGEFNRLLPGQLTQYGVEGFLQHLQEPDKAIAQIREMGIEPVTVLQDALEKLESSENHLKNPLQAWQFQAIEKSLKNHENPQLLEISEKYAKSVIEYTDIINGNAFDWMKSLGSAQTLFSDTLIHRLTLPHLLSFHKKQESLPSDSEYSAIKNWLQTEHKIDDENAVQVFYNQARLKSPEEESKWIEQVRGLLGVFKSTKLAQPDGKEEVEGRLDINAFHQQEIKKSLYEMLVSTPLATSLKNQKIAIDKADFKIEDHLHQRDNINLMDRVQHAFNQEMSTVQTMEDFEEKLQSQFFQDNKYHTLKRMWGEALGRQMAEVFPELFPNNCKDLQDAIKLLELVKKIKSIVPGQVQSSSKYRRDLECVEDMVSLDREIERNLLKCTSSEELKNWVNKNSSLLPNGCSENVEKRIMAILCSKYFPSTGETDLDKHTLEQTVAAARVLLSNVKVNGNKTCNLMKALVNTEVSKIKNPYAPEHLDSLAALCAVYQTLKIQGDNTFTENLSQSLNEDEGWQQYLAKITKDKNSFEQHFPWVKEARENVNNGNAHYPNKLLDCINFNMRGDNKNA